MAATTARRPADDTAVTRMNDIEAVIGHGPAQFAADQNLVGQAPRCLVGISSQAPSFIRCRDSCFLRHDLTLLP